MSYWSSGELMDRIKEMDNEITHLDVLSLKKETDKAWLFEMQAGKGWWVPKSRCEFDYVDMVLSMPTWLYDKKKEEEYVEIY